jgi:MtfA peptidase
MFGWLRSRRRKRLLAQGVPEAWPDILRENVAHWGQVDAPTQERWLKNIRIFVAEKHWGECGGLVLDDEIRVTIAAQACLLVLGYDDYCFERVRTVLVYPGTYLRRDSSFDSTEHPTLGEAWPRGPIVLSWLHALAGGRDVDRGRNVVLHEFAHHLDDLGGGFDGAPPLPDRAAVRRWEQVTEREYARLVEAARENRVTLLDHYGASNPAEFFAVATECFFMRPQSMARQHTELYALLKDFYRQDPAAWYDEPHDEPVDDSQGDERMYALSVAQTLRQMRLPPGSGDAVFAEAVIHWQNRQLAQALECFSAAAQLLPLDAEVRWYRAAVLLELGQPTEALIEADEAVQMAPNEAEAYRVRGRVRHALGRYAEAVADFDQVLAQSYNDADARQQRQLAIEARDKHNQ